MKNPQGIQKNRYKVVPRVLVFIFKNNTVLLQKGAPDKKLWPNVYNGVGGHIERGENLLYAAYRELNEETGLQDIKLRLCGTMMIDANPETGVMLFVFSGLYEKGELKSSDEGNLEWVDLDQIKTLPIMPDLPVLLESTKTAMKNNSLFYGRSWYDNDGIMRIDINSLPTFFKKYQQR